MEEIKQYLEEKRRKTKDSESNTKIVKSFGTSPLSALKIPELINVMKHFHVTVIPKCRKGELLKIVNKLLSDRNIDPLELTGKTEKCLRL